jgi:transposase
VSKVRLTITAVVVEGRPQADVARTYAVAESWVSRLVARYRADGEAAYEPRSRRPRSRPQATPATTVELVLELRRRLTDAGLDAGADTLVWHLHEHHRIELSRATVYRILRRAGVIVAAPAKRPKSSYIRFRADLPNECWQADLTHHRLADGTDAEILCWIDDHSRYALSVTAHRRVTGPIVVDTFTTIIERHGVPAQR